ncbi:hypothetical protein GF380_01735, partial [Candidatus Uhrbacteria bacterium]|nr:hypothetical protein [Candidatus Uhrbacteria bacterium]
MKRLVFNVIAAAISMTLWIPQVGQAAQTPWVWTDTSDTLTYRDSRLVWTMAHADGNWFYSDGLDLNRGGQAYAFDGANHRNITQQLRNAGLQRVDDIVTDQNNTALFLQDVVRFDHQLNIVAYQDGSYANITNLVKPQLKANEGLSSLIGRNGTWMAVTTHGRIFRISLQTLSVQEIARPDVLNTMNLGDEMRYRVQQGSAATEFGHRLSLLPAGNQWVLIAKPDHGPIQIATYEHGTWSTTASTELDRVVHIAQNGTDLLLIDANHDAWIYTNGYLTKHPAMETEAAMTFKQLHANAPMVTSWNGASWMLIADGKMLYRITTQVFEHYSTTRDYFIDSASNENGVTLLGGAVSEQGLNEPLFPLTAKLVYVSNDPASDQQMDEEADDAQTDHGTGIAAWEWMTPYITEMRTGEQVTYHIGSWDEDGIKQIELYVNGEALQSCVHGGSENAECSITVIADAYPGDIDIFMNAKITDNSDRYTWSNGMTVHRVGTGYDPVDVSENDPNDGNAYEYPEPTPAPTPTPTPDPTPEQEATAFSAWDYVDQDKTTVPVDGEAVFHAGAWAEKGVKRIEILANGTVIKTCTPWPGTGNQDCWKAIKGQDYTNGASIFVNAHVWDFSGQDQWTEGVTLTVTEGAGDPAPTPTPDPTPEQEATAFSAWDYVDQDKTTVPVDGEAVFHAG